MSESALELNLIKALGKLQHLAFDKEFLGNTENIAPDLVPEQYFAFYIGHYNFVVHASFFCAVFIETPIAAVPNSPSALVGLSNIRGALTPVYQLHTALGFPQPKKQFIFSVGKADKAIGLLIDALPVSLSLTSQQQLGKEQEADHETLALMVKSFYFHENKLWHLLNGELLGEQLVSLAHQEKKQRYSELPKVIDVAFT